MAYLLVLADIAKGETKMHHLLAIPEDVAINLPMGIDNYSDIKDHIPGSFMKSLKDLFEETVGKILLGIKKSLVFIRIQQKLTECNLTLDDVFIINLLLSSLFCS